MACHPPSSKPRNGASLKAAETLNKHGNKFKLAMTGTWLIVETYANGHFSEQSFKTSSLIRWCRWCPPEPAIWASVPSSSHWAKWLFSSSFSIFSIGNHDVMGGSFGRRKMREIIARRRKILAELVTIWCLKLYILDQEPRDTDWCRVMLVVEPVLQLRRRDSCLFHKSTNFLLCLFDFV